MTLIDRAKRYLQPNPQESQLTLLKDCIKANNAEALRAVQIMYEDMYGGATFNWGEKAPAAYTLIRWGEIGLETLVESVQRISTPKNWSLIIQILASLAAEEQVPQIYIEIRDKELISLILGSVTEWRALYKKAHKLLHDFILSFDNEDDLCLAVGSQIMTASFRGLSATKELFAAMASRWIAVNKTVLLEYDSLIRNYPGDEPKFQNFFVKHPQLLDPIALEVWPEPNLHGSKYPDFIVRRKDDTYLIIEIECPSKLLITSANQLSADATHAAMQAIDYAAFLVERYPEAQKHFPNFRSPDCLVIIGTESQLSPEQNRILNLENQHRRGVAIVGFDWIAKRAEAVANNTVSHFPEIKKLRVV